MYKVKIKKNIECRGIEYNEGKSYEVPRGVYNYLKYNNALETNKKSKKKKTSEIDIS
jgi:hypothetical protein